MRTRYHAPLLVALLALVVVGVGCELIQAKAAFKDGNKLYKAEDYREAIKEYEQAIAFKPDFAEAHAYLASSHQSLYPPWSRGRREQDAPRQGHRALREVARGEHRATLPTSKRSG